MKELDSSNLRRRSKLWIWIGIGAAGCLTVCAILFGIQAYQYLNYVYEYQKGSEDTNYWVRSLDWSPDGSGLVAGSAGGCITIWDTASGSQIGSYTGIQGRVRSVDWSPDDVMIATGNDRNPEINLWEAETARHIYTLRIGDSLGYNAWSPDGKHLAYIGDKNRILIWYWISRSVDYSFGDPQSLPITGIVWSPDGTMIATSSADSSVVIWEISTGKALHQLKAHQGWVNDLDWSPDGSTIVSVGDDGDAILWNPKTGEAIRRLEEHSLRLHSVAWSPTGDQLATAGLDNQIILWDPQSGNPLARFKTDSQGILSLAWSPDGTRLAAGTGLETVLIWDVRSGKLIYTLPTACKEANN